MGVYREGEYWIGEVVLKGRRSSWGLCGRGVVEWWS